MQNELRKSKLSTIDEAEEPRDYRFELMKSETIHSPNQIKSRKEHLINSEEEEEIVLIHKADLERQEQESHSTAVAFARALKEMYTNDVSFYVMIAGSFRFFGGYALAFFKPAYFQHTYPERDSDFSVINAGMASVLCFISTLAGGILNDRYSHNKMASAYICIASSLISAPALFVCFYF